jgi:CRP/FNR family transcriptional regulator, nitrogen oxide reductase regulator
MDMDVASVFRTFPMFQGLADEELAVLLPLARVRAYGRGEVIFREGEPPASLWLIVRGLVKIVRSTGGRDLILEILGPSDTFGEVAVYDGIPYPATAVSAESSTVLSLPRDSFFAALERHPGLARGLLRELTRHLRIVTRRLDELTKAGIDRRIALLLVRLAERIGQPHEAGTFVPVGLSRQDLAELVGTTIETAIRIMSRWSKQGLVLTEKGGFVIPDLAALAAVGEGTARGQE